MDPAQGFAAQGAGATVILASSHFGYPLSTTHTISGAVIGAGAAKRLSAVRWGVAGNIVRAWILTLPAAGAIGALVYGVTRIFGDGRARSRDRLDPGRRDGRGDLRAALPPRRAVSGTRRVGTVIATVVDWTALRDVVVASLAAGVGIMVAFSFAILGLARFADMRRDERVVGAWAFAGACDPRDRGVGCGRGVRDHPDGLEVGPARRRIVPMSRTTLRNIAVIALVALAVAAIPGGSATAELLLAIISLCFLAAIGFLGYRLYMEHKFTLWSMSDQHRALLYGGVTVATGTLVASDRLFNSGLGTILWFSLLGGSGFAVYHAWMESRRYRI